MTNLMDQHIGELWKRVEEGAAISGKTPDRSELRLGREVYVGETPESAREEARIVLGRPFDEHQYINRKAGGNLTYVKLDPDMPDEDVTVDYMMEKRLDRRGSPGMRRQDSQELRRRGGFRPPAGHHPRPGRPFANAAFFASLEGRGRPAGRRPEVVGLKFGIEGLSRQTAGKALTLSRIP